MVDDMPIRINFNGTNLRFKIYRKFLREEEDRSKSIQEITVYREGTPYKATFLWETPYPGMMDIEKVKAFHAKLPEIGSELGLDKITMKTLKLFMDSLAREDKLWALMDGALSPALWDVVKQHLLKEGKTYRHDFYDMEPTCVVYSELLKVSYAVNDEWASVTIGAGGMPTVLFLGNVPKEEASELYKKLGGM